MGKQELIKEAQELIGSVKHTDCEICHKHASTIKRIESRSNMVTRWTMELVINNLYQHIIAKHSLPA
jgi:hypothetical protein